MIACVFVQMVVLVLVLAACLVACQVVQVECPTWVVLQVLAALVDPLLRKLTKLLFDRHLQHEVVSLTVLVSLVSLAHGC